MSISEKLVVTGATGQLGRLVISQLKQKQPGAQVIALVRNLEAAKDLAERGVELRTANYEDPQGLRAALAGADKVLLISSSEIGRRVQHHRNVIEAAKANNVQLLVYTSLLHCDTSQMALAGEHKETESLIRSSGIPFVLLRNGWYTENYTASIGAALQHGAVLGAAGDGRLSMAPRADYAAAAVAVLLQGVKEQAGKVYELAGDEGNTLADYAAEIAKQSGKPVVYKNMPEADYAAALAGMGLPQPVANLLAQCDAKAAAGALHDGSRDLSKLIGRPTTPVAASVRDALAQLPKA